MRTSRLEAFSDGVLAIIITIMVLELKVPEGHTFSDLVHTTGVGLLTYLLTFVYVGIYWNNHHHMFQPGAARQRRGPVGESGAAVLPVAVPVHDRLGGRVKVRSRSPVIIYGINLLAAAVAYYVLQTVIIRQEGPQSPLRAAIGTDLKGKLSPCPLPRRDHHRPAIPDDDQVGAWIAMTCFVIVAIMWLVPDRRIERVLREHDTPG